MQEPGEILPVVDLSSIDPDELDFDTPNDETQAIHIDGQPIVIRNNVVTTIGPAIIPSGQSVTKPGQYFGQGRSRTMLDR